MACHVICDLSPSFLSDILFCSTHTDLFATPWALLPHFYLFMVCSYPDIHVTYFLSFSLLKSHLLRTLQSLYKISTHLHILLPGSCIFFLLSTCHFLTQHVFSFFLLLLFCGTKDWTQDMLNNHSTTWPMPPALFVFVLFLLLFLR
jgi:hypothetical protein